MQTIGSAEGKHSAGRLPIKSVICYSLVDLVSIVVPPNNVVPYSFCPQSLQQAHWIVQDSHTSS